jgi:hypothetical protein
MRLCFDKFSIQVVTDKHYVNPLILKILVQKTTENQ